MVQPSCLTVDSVRFEVSPLHLLSLWPNSAVFVLSSRPWHSGEGSGSLILESASVQKWKGLRDLSNLCKSTILLRSSLSSMHFPILLGIGQSNEDCQFFFFFFKRSNKLFFKINLVGKRNYQLYPIMINNKKLIGLGFVTLGNHPIPNAEPSAPLLTILSEKICDFPLCTGRRD